ncbi:MAG TPA: hypothetical protein VGO33_06015 [Gemmatimonadaceae bacterium]|nr:hypothetical protein [Gemmatimonadaceae bacterium]
MIQSSIGLSANPGKIFLAELYEVTRLSQSGARSTTREQAIDT